MKSKPEYSLRTNPTYKSRLAGYFFIQPSILRYCDSFRQMEIVFKIGDEFPQLIHY